MRKQSPQVIEDFYLRLGYSGERLRKALKKDKEYQKLLNARKQKLSKQARATKTESKKYVLSIDADFEILKKCKLSVPDKEVVKLIKSQLENDWRKRLIQKLDKLQEKHNAY